jgi:hypothetical protein
MPTREIKKQTQTYIELERSPTHTYQVATLLRRHYALFNEDGSMCDLMTEGISKEDIIT